MPNLLIVNRFAILSQGGLLIGKQGLADDAENDEYAISVTGNVHRDVGTIATATVRTVYDDDTNFPADWKYAFLWSDQTVYVQLIGSSTNVTIKVAAFQPFVLPGFDSLLAVANTTPITGGSEPTLQDCDSILVGNYSGSTANYVFAVID